MIDSGWQAGPPATPRGSNLLRLGVILLAVLLVASGGFALLVDQRSPSGPSAGASSPPGTELTIAGSAPTSWDPARVGDAGSAAMLSQVFEGLTALDARNAVQPALASRWSIEDGGKRVVFDLRPGITFSDGRAITANDVVASWLRVIDPAHPSPLANLLTDVTGVKAYLAGTGPVGDVGLQAQGNQVVVTFRRPAAYFVSAAASPTLAVVPPDLPATAGAPALSSGLVVSGAYLPSDQTATSVHLTGNPNYWAGEPPIGSIQVITDLAGRSPVDAFGSGDVDYTAVGSADAAWISYDSTLGPQLRRTASLSVEYYGFDTTRPPFDSADVRRAFAMAVDWRRLVRLDELTAEPATSLVPVGVEGRSTGDFVPPHDVAAAKAALSRAGYPNGKGFPTLTIVTSGGEFEEGVAQQLKDALGIDARVEVMAFDEYSTRLEQDPPQMWALSWIADYPHPQDFLGLLLETGSVSNYGRWSNPQYDAALDAAAATEDPAAQAQQYATAQQILKDQVPIIPLRYGEDWALSRAGLLGASETGGGFVRYAGLAWGNR
jgi:ABC-type oligopeptide transport system substrate-binding subunit